MHFQQQVAMEQNLLPWEHHEDLLLGGMQSMADAHQNEVGKQNFVVAVQERVDEGCGYARIRFDNAGMHALQLTVVGDFRHL